MALSKASEPTVFPGKVFMKATGLGTFLMEDTNGQLLGVQGSALGEVGENGGPETAGGVDEWAIRHGSGATYAFSSRGPGRLEFTATLAPAPATSCTAVPEA